jgi:hypothetical protein
MEFSVSEKFRLEIHWDKVIYDQDGVTKLDGCYLSGPVIKEVAEMDQKDVIALDFGNQYVVFTPNYYVAKLSWEGVRHTPHKIYLDNAILKNRFLNSVPNLNDDDYIIVDTKNHEDDKHQYHLSYPAYLIKFGGEVYNFGVKNA